MNPGNGFELGEELVAYEPDLPDVSDLVPVRTLEQVRAGIHPGASKRAGVRDGSDQPDGPRERLDPVAALKQFWGYDAFRPLQADSVAAALAGKDCLVVLPTGGGKSICYQVPPACGLGLTLVISPLIALMDDQVAAAREAGLRAAAVHSNLAVRDKTAARDALAADGLDLLYVSPERLILGDLLPHLARGIGLIAVDEAHCVSHWGHDFRPEYRQLAALFDRLPRAPRMALTATATAQVQDDIAVQLGLRQPVRLIGHVDRANLVYRSFQRANRLKQVMEVVGRHPGEGGIVYAQTRKEVEDIAEALRKAGIDTRGYHAGMPPEVRAKAQADFVNERLQVVVATIAFGMGIDRSNVRFVIHANCPKSIEHYQQEAGRAGRDGETAECVLLWSAGDLATHRFLAAKDGPLAPDRQRALDRQLKEIARYAVSPLCRHRLLTEHFDQAYPAPGAAPASPATAGTESAGCGACDVCLGETLELSRDQAVVTAQKILSAVWRLNGRFGTGMVVDVLLGRDGEKIRRGGFATLSVYGLLKDAGEPAIRGWVDQLVVQGFLAVVEERDYPLLTLTEAGRLLCKGTGEVRLGALGGGAAGLGSEKTATRERRRAAKEAATAAMSGDPALFERLRAFRRLVAERQGVPPYVVFPDTTLHAIAAVKPADLTALRGCKGIGDHKLKAYGKAVLALIAGATPEVAAGQ